MILLDTTILVYAVGDPHPLQQPCRGLIGLISEGDIEATTTTEVIQEFAHVRSRRRTRGDATKLARDYAGLLQPLARVEEVDLLDGLGIFEAVPQIDAFDAILAAVSGETASKLSYRRTGFWLGRWPALGRTGRRVATPPIKRALIRLQITDVEHGLADAGCSSPDA